MFNHYLLTAWRNFLRYKIVTAMNVVGLALGFTCFVAAIGTYAYFQSADRHLPHSDRVVMILQRYTDTINGLHGPLMSTTSSAVATSIRKELPQLPVAFTYGIGAIPVSVDGRRVNVETAVADDELLDIVDLPRMQLQPGNPLLSPRTAVLTDGAARKLFGDEKPIGRTLRLQNALDVTVAAVLKPTNLPSHMLGPQVAYQLNGILISRSTGRALTEALSGKPYQEQPLAVQWSGITWGSATYVLLPADGSLTQSALEARLQGLPERNGAPDVVHAEIRVASLSQAWLRMLDVNLFSGSTKISLLSVLFALGVATLAVAFANYVNISIAQAHERTKETGLRRAIGASRAQLAAQALVEVAAHALAAASIAFVLIAFLGNAIEAKAGVPLLGSVLTNERFWLVVSFSTFSAVGLLVMARLAALTLAQPSHALRVNSAQLTNRVGANLLLGAQFVTTSVLVVILFVVYAQDQHARALARNTSVDALVKLDWRYRLGGSSFDVWRTALLQSPAVKGVITTSAPPWTMALGLQTLKTIDDRIVNPNAASVSYDFEKVLDLQVISGRAFSRDFGDADIPEESEQRIIIDETLARELGFRSPVEATGKQVRHGGFMQALPAMRIVGVVADKPMRLQPMLDFVGSVYLPDGESSGVPIVRIDKTRVSEGLAAIDATWHKLNPGEPVTREFVDESFAKRYAIYDVIGKALTAIAAITLFVAMMGGFGFALFVANRRAHEIGVRKTLGAHTREVFAMLLKDFSKPILIANILGWPMAYYAAQRYLSTFEQPVALTAWYFVAGVLFTLLVAWVAVSHQTWRAARVNPATVLRHE